MKKVFLLVAIHISGWASAQVPFSLATSFAGLHNVTASEKFWAIGQSVQGNFHFTPTETAYASLSYFTEGKFKNNFIAVGKSISVTPSLIAFTATGRLTYRQISLGWKHYFTGTYSTTDRFSFYGTAGFGYLFAKVSNSAEPAIDTTNYASPVAFGSGKVKRLSFDISGGGEMHIGGSLYAFANLQAWLPASYHPSPYLHNNDRVPLALVAGVGLRVLFDFVY